MNTPLIWQNKFPDSLPENWNARTADLCQAQSLTAALRALGHDFAVELLYLGEIAAQTDISGQNSAPSSQFVRDVLLLLDGVPIVQARSSCSPQSQFWRGLLDCGTQPLGEKLFDSSLALQRSAFAFCCIENPNPSDFFRRPVAARKSAFDKNGEILELTEYFLADLPLFVR